MLCKLTISYTGQLLLLHKFDISFLLSYLTHKVLLFVNVTNPSSSSIA